MEDLIAVVSRLQEVLATFGEARLLHLPQLVAIGSQSAGKSSVLEQLVGRDFLPKGAGVVTRTPLVLQLVHLPRLDKASDAAGGEYGEFLHMKTRLHSFDDIRREIERETARLAGAGKAISQQPIYLKIFSPDVLNLTVIDLPGLTKIPVGDQPSDIETQTKNLVLDYISNPNCIILAVSPANVDLANSDSLKLARKVDPEGLRTIGLLTKLDLMDSGTDALDVLRGKTYPLRLGFIAVVNRSQSDINKQKSMIAARKDEVDFFANHPAYSDFAARCGTDHLIRSLNTILLDHIRAKMPEIKSKLTRLITQTQHELLSYGDPQLLIPSQKGSMVLRLLTRYATDFNAAVEGTISLPIPSDLSPISTSSSTMTPSEPTSPLTTTLQMSHQPIERRYLQSHSHHSSVGYHSLSLSMSTSTSSLTPHHSSTGNDLSGGARIYHVFTSQFGTELESLDPCGDLMPNDIHSAIRNATGPRPALFVPEAAFDLLVKPQIIRLEAPSLRCVELVFDELVRIAYSCCPLELKRYSRFRERIVNIVIDLLRERMTPTATYVESLVAIQKAYINTNHPDFIGGGQAVAMLEKQTTQRRRERERERMQRTSAAPFSATMAATRSVESRSPRTLSLSVRDMGNLSSFPSVPRSPSASSTESMREKFQSSLTEAAITTTPVTVSSSNNSGILSRSFNETGSIGRTSCKTLMSLAAAQNVNVGLADVVKLDLPHQYHHQPARDIHNDSLTDREDFEIQLIRILIVSYFSIVRKTMADLVPKAVMHLMVNYTRESLQNRLVQSLYKEDLYQELLQEDETLMHKRQRCKTNLETYKKAFAVINETY